MFVSELNLFLFVAVRPCKLSLFICVRYVCLIFHMTIDIVQRSEVTGVVIVAKLCIVII